jgi:hypothetical protein
MGKDTDEKPTPEDIFVNAARRFLAFLWQLTNSLGQLSLSLFLPEVTNSLVLPLTPGEMIESTESSRGTAISSAH